MKMLQLIREMLRLLGVCLECGATRRDFYLSAFVNVLILASFFAIITSSDMYLYENLDEIGEAIFCLMQIVSFVAISGTYVSFMLKKRSIFDFFNEMQEFVDERERLNPANYRFYREAEHRSFSVTKWPILIYLAYVDFMIIGTTIFTVIFEMIPVRSEPTTWYTILRISPPYDENTNYGYLLNQLLMFIVTHTYAGVFTATVAFFLSVCFYIEAFCADHCSMLGKYDAISSNNLSIELHIEPQIMQNHQFHVKIHKFFGRFSGLLNETIFIQMVSSSIFVSTALFVVRMSSDSLDSNYFITRMAVVVSICAILPHCYYSTVITLRLQRVADDIYNSSWYKLPNRLKIYYVLGIAAAQPARFFTGFGLIKCSLETFKMILNTSLSYYVMFNNL